MNIQLIAATFHALLFGSEPQLSTPQVRRAKVCGAGLWLPKHWNEEKA
jgi:hypothetical protein